MLYLHQPDGQKRGIWQDVVEALIDKGALRVLETKVGNLSRALSDYEQAFGNPLGSYYRGDLISSDKKYFYCAECSRPGADPSKKCGSQSASSSSLEVVDGFHTYIYVCMLHSFFFFFYLIFIIAIVIVIV
jgi:hypothetical protein